MRMRDYDRLEAKIVDSWLDDEAIRNTGLEDGFDEFFEYWNGECGSDFSAKIAEFDGKPVAVVTAAYDNGFVTIQEIIVAPDMRGRGIGTWAINELVEEAPSMYGPIETYEAVVFFDNVPSQKAFEKAGFDKRLHENSDAYIYSKAGTDGLRSQSRE